MSSKKKSSSKRSKKSSKKSPAAKAKSREKVKTASKPKSAPKSPDKSAGRSSKSIKRKTSSKEPKASKSTNKSNDKFSRSQSLMASGGIAELTSQLDKARKRLNQLDAECRIKMEEEAKKFGELEAEQAEVIRRENRAKLESTVKQMQEECQAKIDVTQKELKQKQSEVVARLKKDESKASLASEGKRAELEKEINSKQEEAKADVETYRKKRENELAIQIERLQKQCEDDVKEYTTRRMEASEQLLEQIRQKLDLEIKNEKQKDKLNTTLKVDKVKECYQKAIAEEVSKLNAALAQAIAAQKASHEAHLELALADNKKAVLEQLDKSKGRLQNELREERTQLEAAIDEWENAIKSHLKQEQRQLERRKLMKQELLAMMAYEDTRKLADEELIASRFHFKIERSQIVKQSTASTVYVASTGNSESCACKVTMLAKWSVRHRADFGKHATKLARYLAANYNSAPYFLQVIDVLATDTKVYTFLKLMPRPKTLAEHLDSLTKAKKSADRNKTDRNELRSGLRKTDLTNVLIQVVKAVAFLNNIFIAHANLTVDNVTLLSSGEDLSQCQLVITGLTRPIVYYNVESDSMMAIKGFDPSADTSLDCIDHLPPECFESEFQATHLDAYSVGVLAHRMLRLVSPFAKYANLPKKMIAKKKADSVKLSLDKSESEHCLLVSLISALTAPKLSKRKPVDEILNHGYFKK